VVVHARTSVVSGPMRRLLVCLAIAVAALPACSTSGGGGTTCDTPTKTTTVDMQNMAFTTACVSANANDMLLSGTLLNGQLLANRAAALDHPLGKGHVVMFAIRPFWRWQTQGTYTLGFNAIMNWNDLDAGKAAPGARGTGAPAGAGLQAGPR